MAFRVESVKESPVWCFASNTTSDGTRTVYAGTGPSGEVLKSTDLDSWSRFTTVDDSHVRAMMVWANALFIGTQPNGRIFVHNFSSGNEYMFVETEGKSVTAFAEYNGMLFAGTAPTGVVYSFDGNLWREEYRPYGSGVTAMTSSNSQLLVFSMGAEGPVSYDGSTWKTYQEPIANGQTDTIASTNLIKHNLPTEMIGGVPTPGSTTTEVVYGTSGLIPIYPSKVISTDAGGTTPQDVSQVNPATPQFNLSAAIATPNGTIFGGLDNGVVLLGTGSGAAKLCDTGSQVTGLLRITDKAIMVASGGTLFLATPSAPIPSPATSGKT